MLRLSCLSVQMDIQFHPSPTRLRLTIAQQQSSTCIANLGCVWIEQTFGKMFSSTIYTLSLIVCASGQANKTSLSPPSKPWQLIVPSARITWISNQYIWRWTLIFALNVWLWDMWLPIEQEVDERAAVVPNKYITWFRNSISPLSLWTHVPGCLRCECGSIAVVLPTPTLLNPFEL